MALRGLTFAALAALLLGGLPPALAETPDAGAASCPDDLSRPRLLEALRTLELQAATDAAWIIEAYEVRRQALCREVAALTAQVAAEQERAAHALELLASERRVSALYEAEWRAAMTKVAAPCRRSPIAWGPGTGLDKAISRDDKVDWRVGGYIIWVLGP